MPNRRPLRAVAAVLLALAAGLGLAACGDVAGDGQTSPPSTSPTR